MAWGHYQCDNPACGRRFGIVGPGRWEPGKQRIINGVQIHLCQTCGDTLTPEQLTALAALAAQADRAAPPHPSEPK